MAKTKKYIITEKIYREYEITARSMREAVARFDSKRKTVLIKDTIDHFVSDIVMKKGIRHYKKTVAAWTLRALNKK